MTVPVPLTHDRIGGQLRNAPCRCNSGLRYKHCCGSTDAGAASIPARYERCRMAALAMQQRAELCAALDAYDALLRERDQDWDVAHMRATCLYQIGALADACIAFKALLGTPAEELPGFRTNLGLLLAAICADPASPSLQRKLDAYRRHRPTPSPPSEFASIATVSVVMPSYMHERYAGEAIASVFAHTRPPLELIVIDDGSSDSTADRCRAALAAAPFPVHFIARENRGAAATLNQGLALARGDFIQLLNSDDRLPPRRIEIMLAALLECEADWGYARVSFIDDAGRALNPRSDARTRALMAAQDSALMSPTLGLSMLRSNSAISSGNLMLRRQLWEDVGGFRDYRYNHDWDFCLRAALESEPVLVPHPLYEYRIHGSNTITEAGSTARSEHQRLMAVFVEHTQSRPVWPNAFAPTLDNWGGDFLALLGATDALDRVPRAPIERALLSCAAVGHQSASRQ
jgi:glycosyltransferase involved in cell wall biosynthesis